MELMEFEIDDDWTVAEPEVVYGRNEVNSELNTAWDIIENTDSNLFLTGKAGTGKTTFLKKLREKSRKNILVLAPTGIAAINASGATIHSFFQFPLSPFVPGQGFISSDKRFLRLGMSKRSLLQSVSLLVIDEVSMVRPDIIDAIDQSLRKIRRSSRPFGGVQLLLIGDLRQLPPVLRDEEWKLLSPHYQSPYFYESIALKNAGFQIVELTMVYRQRDREFVDILNKIRDGNIDNASLKKLNDTCLLKAPLNEEGYIRLTTHNQHCARINNERLNSLPGETFVYDAEVEGKFPESSYPADGRLRLKVGAQVIFVKNDIGAERRFYNGLIGTVVSLSGEKVRVRIPNGRIVDVVRVEWENLGFIKNEVTGKIEQKVEGVFRQFPLQLAWAITIHKSQGLTFDKAIIDATNSFAPGQTYVALSRCRNMDGLKLERPISMHSVITDQHVSHFIQENQINKEDQNKLEELKKDYLFNSFRELFNFNALSQANKELISYSLMENDFTLEDGMTDLFQMRYLIDKDIIVVAEKFTSSYTNEKIKESEIHSDHFLERIKKAAKYFIDKLRELEFYTDMLPVGMNFTEHGKKLLASFIFELQFNIQVFNYFTKEDFSPTSFEIAKEKARLQLEEKARRKKANPTRIRNFKKKTGVNKPKTSTVDITFGLLREGKSIEEIARTRSLKEDTIVTHLLKLIQSGKIKKEDVIDFTIYPKVKEKIESMIGHTFQEIWQSVNKELLTPLPSYLFRLYYHLEQFMTS